MNETLLELRKVEKAFGPNLVLRGIDLTLRRGEIVALLGENGAGKSTLVNIIAGSFRQSGGEILYNGEKVGFRNPREALEAGIALIHQELSLIRSMTVKENIFLNSYFANASGFISRSRMSSEGRRMLDGLGGKRISVDALAETLSAADQQTVEIAKALVNRPQILIMDEPTSSLTRHEADALFDVVRRLRDDGVTIVFIGHKLDEAFALADRMAVMRDGVLVLDKPTDKTSLTEVVESMVGRDIDMSPRWSPAVQASSGNPVLELDGVSDAHLLSDVSFSVRKGEVVGLFGLVGAGRSELMLTIVGDRPHTSGRIVYKGQEVRFPSPRHALEQGIAMLPEGRKAQGIFPGRSIYENMNVSCAGKYQRFGFMNDRALLNDCRQYVDRFQIKTQTLRQRMEDLSGGNQQKVLLSRLLLCNPDVILLDEPTHGVDIRTKAQIYDTIAELAANGVAVVLVSSELPELLINAHRIVVMAAGVVRKEIENGSALEEKDVVRHAFPD
jgi:ribose transport system ATP-binding protein